jgi:hypothetical protein
MTYQQDASAIHSTRARDGTVTLIHREFLEDRDHADVFYPVGSKWTSAEARPATKLEIDTAISLALLQLHP